MAVIYAFGDSITYGAWDIENSGWAAMMRRHFDDLQEKDPNLYFLFYNLGIPGETTEGLVKRFAGELEAREREDEEAIFTFAFGANDDAFIPAENRFRVSKEEFKANIEDVISKALKISPKVLLINILPVNEDINREPRNGKVRLNKYMQEYNLVLSGIADQFKLPLVDVYSVFMKADYEKLLNDEDGLHPNAQGHKVLFDTIRPELEKIVLGKLTN